MVQVGTDVERTEVTERGDTVGNWYLTLEPHKRTKSNCCN